MTKNEWENNINNRIITEEMMALCIHSFNKRAKNYRKIEYNLKNNNGNIEDINKAINLKKKYYQCKYKILELVEPKEIHLEKHMIINPDVNIFDYEVSFRYYLAYKINDFVFHYPIKTYELNKYKYKKLKIKDVGNVYSDGEEEKKLLPLKYCKELLILIDSKNYILKCTKCKQKK